MNTETQIKKLIKKRDKSLSLLENSRSFLKGSINDVCGKCKRSKCTCDKKTNIRDYRLTYKDSNQKTKIIYIKRGQLKKAKILINNYSKVKKALDEALAINIEIFKLSK